MSPEIQDLLGILPKKEPTAKTEPIEAQTEVPDLLGILPKPATVDTSISNQGSQKPIVADLLGILPQSQGEKPLTIQEGISSIIGGPSDIVAGVKQLYTGLKSGASDFFSFMQKTTDLITKATGLPQETVWKTLSDKIKPSDAELSEGGLIGKINQAFGQLPGAMAKYVPPIIAAGPAGGMAAGGMIEKSGEGLIPALMAGGKGALEGGILGAAESLTTPLKSTIMGGLMAGQSAMEGGKTEDIIASGVTGAALGAIGKSGPTGVKEIASTFLNESTYQKTINRFASIENITKMAKEAGATVLPGQDPAIIGKSYLGIGGKVKAVLEDQIRKVNPDGTFTYVGEGLKPILTEYDRISPEKNENIRKGDLKTYVEAVRTIEDLQRPKNTYTTENIVTHKQVQLAQDHLADLTTKYGKLDHFAPIAERLYTYQRNVLHTLVDSGHITQVEFDRMIAANPHYVPFERIMDQVDPASAAGIAKQKEPFTGAKDSLKRIEGSERETYDPIESIVKNTYRIMDVYDRNMVARGIASFQNIPGLGISKVSPAMTPINVKAAEVNAPMDAIIFRPSQRKPSGNVIEYFEDGKPQYIEVPKNLYDAMTGLNEVSVGLFTKIMSYPAQALRTGATITPEFMARNPIRDQWTTFFQTHVGFKPFVDPMKSVADLMGKTQTYYDWLASGGGQSTFMEMNRASLEKKVNELKKDPSLLSRLNIIKTAGDVSQFMEQLTRLGVFKAAERTGLSPMEAGNVARKGGVDFGVRGSQTQDITSTVAFLNAGLQSVDTMAKEFKNNPGPMIAKGVATVTIPSVLLWLKNHDDPDYKELPRWQKDLFWQVYKNDDGSFVQIPKPFFYGQLFGTTVERFLDYASTQDPTAFKGFARTIVESAAPVQGNPSAALLPTAIKPLIENEVNWSFFRERPVVPKSTSDLSPFMQYGKYTTETAKTIGRSLNVSPSKVDNYVQGFLGGSGAYAMKLLDEAQELIDTSQGKIAKEGRPLEYADIPLVKGFVTRPAISNPQSLNDFYEDAKKLNEGYLSYRRALTKGNQEEMNITIKSSPLLFISPSIEKIKEGVNSLTEQINQISDSQLTQEDKREQIRQIEKLRLQLAKQGNEIIKKGFQMEEKLKVK